MLLYDLIDYFPLCDVSLKVSMFTNNLTIKGSLSNVIEKFIVTLIYLETIFIIIAIRVQTFNV